MRLFKSTYTGNILGKKPPSVILWHVPLGQLYSMQEWHPIFARHDLFIGSSGNMGIMSMARGV